MAKAILHEPKAAKINPDAHEELERLLETLHENGVLRFANDLVGAKTPVTKTLVEGLSTEGSLNAMQNIAILFMALSRIPPNEFYKTVFAAKEMFGRVGNHRSEGTGSDAPGVIGAYKMLHDDELWRAIMPVLEGLKSFGKDLDKEVTNPISAFSGKEGSP